MALGKQSSNTDKLVSQSESNEIIPFTAVYIKEEQPQEDYITSIEGGINYYMSEQQPSGAIPFSNNANSVNKKKIELTGFTNDEWDVNTTVLFAKDKNRFEEKPHVPDVPLFKSELESNESNLVNKSEDCEIKSYLKKNVQNKDKLEELLHEEIDITVEDKGKWENKDGVRSVIVYETNSNSPITTKHTADNGNKLHRVIDYKISHFRRSKQRSGQKTFACDQCDFSCTRKSNLKQHRVKHSGEKPFACDLCDYRCNRNSELSLHQMKHSGREPFACDQCDYTTLYSNHLKRHQMKHSGENPFSCDQCDYSCISKSSLTQHQMKHAGEHPFACDQCGYTTLYSNALRRHQMKHSGENPFSCEQCDYRCISKSSLKQHQMKHLGEKPFACDLCDYTTLYSHALKRHQMKHSEENPFTCGQCDFKTKYFRNLKEHRMVHSGETRFACNICDYKCRHKSLLKQHLMKHSGDK